MNGEHYLLFWILPLVGALIPIFRLKGAYYQATNDPVMKMKLDEPFQAPPPPENMKQRRIIFYLMTFFIVFINFGINYALLVLIPIVIELSPIKSIFKKKSKVQPKLSTKIKPMVLMMALVSLGVFIYGPILSLLVNASFNGIEIPSEIANLLISSIGMLVGLSVLGAGIGMGYVVKESVEGIIIKFENIAGYFIWIAIAEGIVLYGVVMSFMILGRIEEVDLEGAKVLYNSMMVLGGSLLLGGILVGYLPSRIDIPKENRNWIKKLLLVIIGESVALMGIVYGFNVFAKIFY